MEELIIIEYDKEFIPVYKTEKGTEVINGRELHKGLKVAKDFSDWIKDSLERVDAVENIDYFKFSPLKGKTSNLNGRPKIEYIIKLETAKEICLIAGASPRANKELKEKSKAYRRYLISVEERCKNEIINGNIKLDDEIIRKMFMQDENSRNDIIKKIFSPKEEFNLDTKELLKELRELRREVENLNSKINILSDNQNRNSNIETSKINYKDENIIDDFNYSRFLNHINNLTDNTVLTKKEFLNLFNSYKFYHKELGIMALNKFMNENNLIYGNDRITDYAKENNILIRDTYKNHSKVFLTKKGIIYISNIITNSVLNDYKTKRK